MATRSHRLISVMGIDEDSQSEDLDEFYRIQLDPFIVEITEEELWQYLQLVICVEPMETEIPIDDDSH